MRTTDEALEELLRYIERHRKPVPFEKVHKYMDAAQIDFGPAVNTIEMLEVAAHETGRVSVDRDHRVVYGTPSRHPAAIQ